MTTPKINTINRGGSRYYVHPETGAKVPGVTSVLNMLPKGFLQFWSAKVVATYAVDNLPSIVGLALNGDRQGAIDYLKGAPRRDTAQAAAVGSKAHEAFEARLQGKEPIVTPEVKPFLLLFDRFIKDVEPVIERQEQTVYNATHDYMGSFDGFGTIAGKRAWFDWKTTRSGVHPEVAIQLAAYRYSEYILHPDGTSEPTPPADGGLVLHVRPEGLQLWEVDCDESVFEFFLHLRHTFRWIGGKENEVIANAPAYEVTYEDAVAAAAPTRRRRRADA